MDNPMKPTHEVAVRIWSFTARAWWEPGKQVHISKQGKGGGAGRAQVMDAKGHLAVICNKDLRRLA